MASRYRPQHVTSDYRGWLAAPCDGDTLAEQVDGLRLCVA